MAFSYGISNGYGGSNHRTRMLHRGLNLTVPPGGEPVSLEEANNWDKVTNAKENDLTEALISTARMTVEDFTRLQLNTATWEVTYDHFPTIWGDAGDVGSFTTERWGVIELPKNPVQSVSSIAYIDDTGVPVLMPAADYIVDIASKPARIAPAFSKFWPATQPVMNAVTITMVCGYGDWDVEPNPVPAGLRTAMKLLILDMYLHREAQSDTLLRENRTINNLLNQFKLPSLADVT